MARKREGPRTLKIIPSLKQILQLNLLEGLINQQSSNNNSSGSSSSSNSSGNIILDYLKIILSFYFNETKEIEDFINNNKELIESLCKESLSYESVKSKERLAIEFIIKKVSVIPDSLFYEYYSIYFIEEIDNQFQLNGKVYSEKEIQENEDKIFQIIFHRLEDLSLFKPALLSLVKIASSHLSIKALKILEKFIKDIEPNPLIFDNVVNLVFCKGSKNLVLTQSKIIEFFKFVFSNSSCILYEDTLWMGGVYRKLIAGSILDFNEMESNEIIQLFNFLSENSSQCPFSEIFTSLSRNEIKNINLTVWKWCIKNTLQDLYYSKYDCYLTIPFRINSKEFIDFIFENNSVFRLVTKNHIIKKNDDGEEIDNPVIKARKLNIYDDGKIYEFNQYFKITEFELVDYFYQKMVQLRSNNSVNDDDYSIKRVQLYYYLFKESLMNCDIETLKKIDSLGLQMEKWNNNISCYEEPLISRFSNKVVKLNSKLKQFKLYNDRNSRVDLLHYLSSSGFKSFTFKSFYKLFIQLIYQVDIFPISYEKEENLKQNIQNAIDSSKLFSNQELNENRSLINFELNQDLFYQLTLHSIYKLNFTVLNFLLSSTSTINQELLLKSISNDTNSYSFVVHEYLLTTFHQYENIYSIIQLLLSKLPPASDQFPIEFIYKYLYKAIIQSRNCTLDKIKQINSIYINNSISIDNDYFNVFYWFHNRSTRLSYLLKEMYNKDSKCFSNLTHLIKVEIDFDLLKFDFNFISNSTFNCIIEQFDRIKIFKKFPDYFLNIGHKDLYIKTLKEYLNQKDEENEKEEDEEDEDKYQHLCLYISLIENDQEIQQLLDLKINGYYYQKLLDISIELHVFKVFKYIVDNFKNAKEKENLNPLEFSLLFDYPQIKLLKYAIENHYDQLELFFSTKLYSPTNFWFTNINLAELLIKHFPTLFYFDSNICLRLLRSHKYIEFNYYYQKGYLNNIIKENPIISIIQKTKDLKNLLPNLNYSNQINNK